ncbi:hypothetical protein [Streptomyces sp. NPDC059979]|uniref:hypothetical protein n=1 Tax=unclassified Streptomyces TaxID=2593676 RepID=UPI0036536BB8
MTTAARSAQPRATGSGRTPPLRRASYLTDTTDSLHRLIRDIKAGTADHPLGD